jgi:hypothetical protein
MATDVRGDLHVLTRHPRGDDDVRAAPSTARRSAAGAWLAERWPAVAVLAVAIPLACISIAGTLYWPGRAFPGFFLLGNRIVPTIGVYDWTGLAAGVPFYARVTAVDGRAVTSNREVYDHVAALPIGAPVRYALVKDGVTLTRVVPTMAFTATHYWLTVGAFVAFGF